MRRFAITVAAAVAALTALSGVLTADAAKTGQITQYNIPGAPGPNDITVGADGNLWFGMAPPFCCNTPNFQIGQLTPSGQLTTFTTPSGGRIGNVTLGPDGNIWFIEFDAGQIASITPQGAVTEYPVPQVPNGSGNLVTPDLSGLTAGPDGALWFGSFYPGGLIGRMTVYGSVMYFKLPSSASEPADIVSGPDGALWFTDPGTNTIGRITTAGDTNSFALPSNNGFASVGGLTFGPDGNIWFTDGGANMIGRMTLAGKVTEFPVPSHQGRPDIPGSITTGHDGALWFTLGDTTAPGIGRITTSGKMSEIATPNLSQGTSDIVAGPPSRPKTVWFTQTAANDVDVITTR